MRQIKIAIIVLEGKRFLKMGRMMSEISTNVIYTKRFSNEELKELKCDEGL